MPSARLVNWRLNLRAALPMLTGPGNPVGSCALPMPSDDPRHRHQAAAQRQRVGVWAVPGGIQRPWDWRHGTRRPGQAAAPSTAPSASTGGYSARMLTRRQIGSYARAQELLREGHTFLDRSGDGIACKSLRMGRPVRVIWPDRQNAPGLSMLRRGQGLNASWPDGQPLPFAAVMAASRRGA
jgi:hypothetical protein